MVKFPVYFVGAGCEAGEQYMGVRCPKCNEERLELFNSQRLGVAQCPVCLSLGTFQLPNQKWHHPDPESALMATRKILAERDRVNSTKTDNEPRPIEIPSTGTPLEEMEVEK